MNLSIDCDKLMVVDSSMRDYNRKLMGHLENTSRHKVVVIIMVQRQHKDTNNKGLNKKN